MTSGQAVAFIRTHGVVLESARGPVPTLTTAIAGGPIGGSWWSHPKSHEIFRVLEAVRESQQVLVCRLVAGKVTLIHRRLWAPLVRVAHRFPAPQLAHVRERHTPSGRHVTEEIPFPTWVSAEIRDAAHTLREEDALRALGAWASGWIDTGRRGPPSAHPEAGASSRTPKLR